MTGNAKDTHPDTARRQDHIVRTFMTQDMKDEDILALSTGREAVLERILDALERSYKAAPGTLQHVVLYGNRGFGKSFMTRRVQIETAKRWPDAVPFALLPEEQHNLQRDPHAFLETIALKLTDLSTGRDSAYEEGHFRWPSGDAKAELWQKAEAKVDAALPDGGVAVVVVENFDFLLQRLFRDDMDEQRLRRWLDRRGNRLMLFATATGTVDMDYDRPLFHAFESIRLEPWSGDECISYFNRLRRHQGIVPLSPDSEAKARAVADFIGGTPRLAQLLGDVLETEDALEVAEIMAALTDRLADYYRRRIEDLSPLSIGLLDALIRGGEPASQTELAARVGAKGQSEIARVMTDLQRSDIVRGRPAPKSREKLYRVPDRVFVHYYRLRQGNRTVQDTPLATILDFLRSFYSRYEQRQQSLLHLEDGRIPEAGLFSRLANDGEILPRTLFTRNIVKHLCAYLEVAPGALDKPAEVVAALLDGDTPEAAFALCADNQTRGVEGAIHAVIRAQALYRMGHAEKAKTALQEAQERVSDDTAARFIMAEQLFFLTASRDFTEAALAFEPWVDFPGTLPDVLERRRLRYVAWRHGVLERYTEAVATADEAAAQAERAQDWWGAAKSLNHKAFALARLSRYEDAVKNAEDAAALASKAGDAHSEAECLKQKVFILGRLGRHEDAVATADQATAQAKIAGDISEEAEILCHKAFSLNELGRLEDAWAAASKSVDLARKRRSTFKICWAVVQQLRIAQALPKPEIVPLFGEWLQLYRTSEDDGVPKPRLDISTLFVAVARAGAWDALDALIEDHADWLEALREPVWFKSSDGEALARIAADAGRAAGYAALSEALPRIAALMELLPGAARDRSWLPDLVTGFATACRDAGLLRDVAVLMKPALAPKASNVATLLRTLADVDDAEDPNVALARIDPDIATVIRRLRELPDPETVTASKRNRALRK